MFWRRSRLTLVVPVALAAASACSDAALLSPRVHDEHRDETGGAAGEVDGGVSVGGTTSTGGRAPGVGGSVQAGGSASDGGNPNSGGVQQGTGGSTGSGGALLDGGSAAGSVTGTGGLSGCEGGGRSLEDYCRTVQCNELHEAAPLCYEAAREGRLVSVVVGCGFARMELRQGDGNPFVGGATWQLDTGEVVEAFQVTEGGECLGHKGDFVHCDSWAKQDCEMLFGDGGIAAGSTR